MSFELWALDVAAGEAVLRTGESWLLVSMSHQWRPVELDSPEGILRWALSRSLVRTRREYSTSDEAILTIRRVCQASWRAGTVSSEGVEQLLGEIQQDRERIATAPEIRDWKAHFPEINRAALGLDHFFRARGYPVDESLQLILETLRRLRRFGAWRERGRELSLTLFEIARHVARERRGSILSLEDEQVPPGQAEPVETRGSVKRISDYEERRLGKALLALSAEALAFLALWSEPTYSLRQVALCLGVAPEVAQEHLKIVTESLGRSAEDLRNPKLGDLCRGLIRNRF